MELAVGGRVVRLKIGVKFGGLAKFCRFEPSRIGAAVCDKFDANVMF